jgi:hypothetical protein
MKIESAENEEVRVTKGAGQRGGKEGEDYRKRAMGIVTPNSARLTTIPTASGGLLRGLRHCGLSSSPARMVQAGATRDPRCVSMANAI